MQVTSETVETLVSNIWSSMLGLEIQLVEQPASTESTLTITGCVQITGDWQGAVTFDCPTRLARRVAGVMFDLPPNELDSFLVHDAIGELANMIGGNVKSLLPEHCELSLPAVAQGTDYAFRILDSQVLERLTFSCGPDSFVVTVLGSKK